MTNPRAILKAAAEFFEGRAVEAHANGMAFVRRAARLERLAETLNDDDACKAVQLLEREGLLVVIESKKTAEPVKNSN